MVSDRTTQIGIGSAVTFVISLGTAIPAFGLFLGPFFTFGGGLVGGGVGGWLRGGGATEGAKTGLIVALVGGIASSIVAVVVGTALNLVFVSDSASSDLGGYVVLAAIGFVSGLVFTLIGGLIGGTVTGAIRGE